MARYKLFLGSVPRSDAPTVLSGITVLQNLDASIPGSLDLSGGSLTGWRDQSGNARNVTGTGGNIPYDSTDKSLSTWGGTPTAATTSVINMGTDQTGTAGMNVFIVARRLGTTALHRTLLMRENGNHSILCDISSNNLGSYDTSAFGQAGTLTWAVGDLHLVRAKITTTGTSLSLDGGALQSTGKTPTAGIWFLDNYGGSGGNQNFGKVHQFIVTPVGLSDADAQIVEGHLAWKWDAIIGGTTLVTALPSGHAYKSAAPGGGGAGPTGPWVKHAGIWKRSSVYVKDAGTWKAATVSVKTGGVWKPMT
jgi:hypothetical protein